MNSRSSSIRKGYENEFSEFLIKRIANAGGSIQLQHITGHLSQVRNEVRNVVVSSKSDLLQFLKRHDNLFSIENNVVSLVKSSFSTSGYDSDSSNRSYSNLPLKIKNGKGVVIKIFSGYGFIKSKEPIKTEIFFNSHIFGDRDIDLTSFLHVGSIVFFHAQRKSSNSNCKYQALKVWRNDNGDEASNVILQKTRKNRETGLYDPLNLESEGVIQNIFPNLGFISVKDDDKNTVFFHKNRVVNYDNIVDLTKVFSKGDRVEFTAHRSSKPDAKARWEAAKVWKVSGKVQKDGSLSSNSHLPLSKQPISSLRTKTPEMIKNKCGKIFPRSHGAVIKFDYNEIADGDSALYYVCGTHVTEIGWEFSEGDEVYFDAVKIKSAPGWKAVLVWNGKKPDIVLPTCLGDYSEFTDDDDNVEVGSSIYTSKSSLCMSESSSSSLKSEKLSSKSKDSKKEKTRKYDSFTSNELGDLNKKQSRNHKTSSKDSLNSLSLSDKYSFVGKETKGINKKLSNTHSSSRESLSSLRTSNKYNHLKYSEDIVKSSSDKSVDQLNKMLSNWGDSPYPADDVHESMEASKNFKSDTSLKCDSAVKSYAEDEMENSSEYASAEEEKVDKNPEIENDEIASQNNNLKCTASVKRYCDTKGIIYKVFSRFAEVKSSILPNTISFFSNDFYSNGMPMDELDVDDLSEILKVGDDVNFNCFIIIDDLGQSWQKATLAWQGSKPRYSDEISPEDFIKQNVLSVTVANKINDYNQTEKINHRKFLTSFIDENPDDNTDNLSRTESCSEEESLTLSPKLQNKAELPIDSESLSDTVYDILKSNVFPKNTMVDLKIVSAEITNIILRNFLEKACTVTCDVLSEGKCVTESLENVCSKCKERNKDSVKTKENPSQTIITGDIISQNILADC